MTLTVSRAEPGEAAALSAIAVAAKASWGYPAAWMEAWRPQLAVDAAYLARHPVYVARQDGAAVGFYALEVTGPTASVEHLWVAPAAMRRGVGRALFRHLRATAAALGATTLEIESDPNAEPFYRALGAHPAGHVPRPVLGHPRALPLLRLDLAAGRSADS